MSSYLAAHDNPTIATPIITRYSNQHRQINNIVKKYWHLLMLHPSIGPFVSEAPSSTFRLAKSLKDNLVQIEYRGNDRKDPCKYPGTFTCLGWHSGIVDSTFT